MSNYITTATLNLRKEPLKIKGNVLCILPPDTVVQEITTDVQDGFRQVKTILSSITVEGFASQKYLEPTNLTLPDREQPLQVPLVHYPSGNRIITRNGTGRVFPLNESGILKPDLTKIPNADDRKKGIHDVVNFLDVERSIRYAPDSKNTFCNIYAYDVTYCLGAYLPRVWWTSDSIVKWQQGVTVPVQYDKTVTEYTANRIANWFEKFGSLFGWQRLIDVTRFQQEVNKGQLGILVAQRINMENPGHIVAVVPETRIHMARRSNTGIVISPLQSEAGRNNRKYSARNAWWQDKTRFKKFGFWLWKV